MAQKFLTLNGPNLNLVGERETSVYGLETLNSITKDLGEYARNKGFDIESRQSNSEGTLIDAIQEARGWAAGIIFNAGAYTHTSVGLRDAISAIDIPVVEVHLSNIYAREPFRQKSMLSPVCLGVISGFGRWSYFLAVDALIHNISTK